jgi:threonine dehydratase
VDRAKYEGMVKLGAEVLVSEFDGYDDTQDWAIALAAEKGRRFVSAFDDDDVMAANGGSLAAEVLDDFPDARAFVLPVGGGGLSAGFAALARHRLRDATIVGCQHILSPALKMSMESGRAVTKLPAVETLAGGVEGGIGARTFAVLGPLIDRVALVSEEEIIEGVRWMLRHHQYLIEPTAAVTIAACLTGKCGALRAPAVVVISGRNVSEETVKKIL